MTKAQKDERTAAITKLKEWLQPGDTVYTILRHVSRSGMQREISLKKFSVDVRPCDCHSLATSAPHWIGDPTVRTWTLDHVAALALTLRRGKTDGLIIQGAGMDMGYQLVYMLGRVLWPNGHGCVGADCPSNDHSNGDRDYTPHTCQAHLMSSGNPYSHTHRHAPALDARPARGKYGCCHWHADGGYALQHRWL